MIDLALIPARAGSKRLKNKNQIPLGGYPLIAWTIKAALKSGSFKKVVVSTDSEEIADISLKYGAQVPFIRPFNLSEDNTASISVIEHLFSQISDVNSLTLLQPTSPFRSSKLIRSAEEVYQSYKPKSLVSITKSKRLDWHFLYENSSRKIKKYPKLKSSSENYLDETYCLNGAIYISDKEELLSNRGFLNDNTIGFRMNSIDSIDIDYQSDFEISEAIVESGLRHIDM